VCNTIVFCYALASFNNRGKPSDIAWSSMVGVSVFTVYLFKEISAQKGGQCLLKNVMLANLNLEKRKTCSVVCIEVK
jgi:hypothetical protein